MNNEQLSEIAAIVAVTSFPSKKGPTISWQEKFLQLCRAEGVEPEDIIPSFADTISFNHLDEVDEEDITESDVDLLDFGHGLRVFFEVGTMHAYVQFNDFITHEMLVSEANEHSVATVVRELVERYKLRNTLNEDISTTR